jgi:hypothetical protein
MGFLLRWEIDSFEDDPLIAVRQAMHMQRNPEGTATVFEVWTGDGQTHLLTLDAANGDVLFDVNAGGESPAPYLPELFQLLDPGGEL